ncbi:GDSL-type esterase/lipase family protein [Suttonella indologenes]|uniref:Acyl-CoA thioesterase I n=1 Tax=Suttonella indologenes TaxID=13276 RepID=A0A380MWA0_9GAMM|nr:GDSL-type esterase/lipase family protein [Suttonella indologenes]SUO96845.1 Acyl-CoA thioesterase I precursor [Suttonella indologenes]
MKFLHLIFLTLSALLYGCGNDSPDGRYVSGGSTVLALGDSLTAGYGAGAGEDYPSLLAAKTSWHIVNGGVSGDTSAQALARLPALLAQHQPQLVIISIGGNDFLRRQSAGETRSNIKQIIKLVRETGAQMILVGVPGLNAGAVLGVPRDHELYAEIAAAENITLYPSAWGDILRKEHLRSDQIHPNAAGYALFSEEFYAFLRKKKFL